MFVVTSECGEFKSSRLEEQNSLKHRMCFKLMSAAVWEKLHLGQGIHYRFFTHSKMHS